MARHTKKRSCSKAAFVHDSGTSSQMELLCADVFGDLFRESDGVPAIDQGLWDDVFNEAFAVPTSKAAEATKLRVVRTRSNSGHVSIKDRDTDKNELSVEDAVSLVKARTNAKFDERVEIAMNLGIDPRHASQMVRGTVSLPYGTGITVRVAVFACGHKAEEAKAAGADIVGAEDLLETIEGGSIDFDRCIATPDMMPIVGRLGKVLGPRNLMPNPKVGTVTMNVAEAVKSAKGGQVQFQAQKAGVVCAGIGKASFDEEKLVENVRAFVKAVAEAKPSGAQSVFVKSVRLCSGGAHIDLQTTGGGMPPSRADSEWRRNN